MDRIILLLEDDVFLALMRVAQLYPEIFEEREALLRTIEELRGQPEDAEEAG
jgi:hypothetical protein